VNGILFRGQSFGAKKKGEGGAHFIDIKIKIFHRVIFDESYLRPVSY